MTDEPLHRLSDSELADLFKVLERAVFEDDYRPRFTRPVCFLLVKELTERREKDGRTRDQG